MKEPAWLIRVIECFSNNTDELVCEFDLPNVELTELQRIWKMPADDPIVTCFSINEEQAQFFQQLIDIEFDFVRYSYFLAAYTVDWDATKREGGYMKLFPPPRDLPGFPEIKKVIPKSVERQS